MPESQGHQLVERLRRATDHLEEFLSELESMIDTLSSVAEGDEQAAIMSSVVQLAHRDLSSAQAHLFRASLAQRGIVERLLRAVLGRPMVETSESPDAGSEAALDPFRPTLVRAALEAEKLTGTLTTLRTSMAGSEVERLEDLPDWPDPVVNFAGGMVDGAIENLEDARDLLYRAAELTEDGLVRLWAERMVGTNGSRKEPRP